MNWKTDVPVLTKEEERNLFSLYKKTGNERYKNIILESNIRFIFELTKRYRSYAKDYDDMIAECFSSIEECFEKFDLDKDCRFITYAGSEIKNSALKYLSKNSDFLKIPPHHYKRAKEIKELTDKNNDLTDEEISDKLNIDLKIVKRLRGNIHELVSKDTPLENGNPLEIFLKTYDKPNDKKNLINYLINSLDERKKEVIERLHGLNGYREETTIRIGEMLGVTNVRIRQIRDEAYETMRMFIFKENLEKYDVF